MSWAVGYDSEWERDIGYGVPAVCDHPGCGREIDRGLSHVCGYEPYGGEAGCGLYFCADHLNTQSFCAACDAGLTPFTPTADVREWMEWKLTDESWQAWREARPEKVRQIEQRLAQDPDE